MPELAFKLVILGIENFYITYLRIKEVDLRNGTKLLKSVICLHHIQFHHSISSFRLKQNEINPSYIDAYKRLM